MAEDMKVAGVELPEFLQRPEYNDDAQPSVTSATVALKRADRMAGVPASEVLVKAPADAIDLEYRKAVADQSVEEVVANVAPIGEVEDAGVAAEEAAGEYDDGYDDMTNAELQDELASKGLPTSGTKAELLERLRA